jgi:hypothetical protein
MTHTKRATILFDNRDSRKALLVESWLKKWKGEIKVLSEMFGSGCHHDHYEVEGPEEAIAELPFSVLARDATRKDERSSQ